MTKFRTKPLLFLITLFIFYQNVRLFADDTLLPSEESSSTFLKAEQDSNDVNLFLAGSWKTNLTASTGFGWSGESGFDSSISYSGISSGFTFSQSPDLTVSLLILNHYIFEASFTDEFENSTFMLGYRGGEGDFVQSISAGNMGINISEQIESSDYFRVPDGGASSFGIHAAFSGPYSAHELLLRFDPQEEQTKVYIGSDYVIEIELEAYNYLKGRFFYVPGTPSEADFYLETNKASAELTDDGRFYEKLSSDEYSYSPADGLLFLESQADGAVLAEDSSTGSIQILYDPGIFSTYESAAAYGLNTVLPEDSWKTRAYLAADSENTDSGIELSTEIYSDDGIVFIKPSAGGTVLNPLRGILENPEAVYGENAIPASDVINQKLIFRVREESSSYTIDEPVEGTIRIFINGIENFGWEESGGTISFNTAPGENDRIEITYRTDTGGSTGGDVLFASGNSFTISENWTADINAGLRLNLAGSYSLPGEETSAYGEAAAGIRYENGNDKIKVNGGLTAGLKILTENAAGTLLLKDMSEGSLDIALNRYTVYPGAMSGAISPALEASDRGLLLYKEYRIATGLSSYYLQDYTSTNIDDYTTGSNLTAGPYTTSAVSDGRSGEVLAMDYILPDDSSWTSVQIPVSSGTDNLDLSAYNAFSFDWKAEDDPSDVDIYLEIGSLSEDLDGDGILDAEAGAYSSGYTFNDPNSETGTLIGGDNLKGSNGILDSEDINGNGFLDAEKPGAAVLFKIKSTEKPGTDWQRSSFHFQAGTGETAGSRLKNAEFIRITVVNTTGTKNEGRILFDDFSFEGASMFASASGVYEEPEFSEVDESRLPGDETPDSDLSSVTINSGSDNDVMRISWSDDKLWKLYSYISPVSIYEYGSIIFYMYSPYLTASGTDSMQLNFSMTDSEDRGVKAFIPLTGTTAWRKVEIKTKTGKILIDDEVSADAVLIVDSDADLLNIIEIEAVNTSAGTILIDEIQLSSPSLHAVTGVEGNIEAVFAEPLWQTGSTEIIGPAVISAEMAADINTDTDELSVSASGSMSASGSFTTTILSAPVSADLSWISDGETSAGHNIRLPVFRDYLFLTDDFNTNDVSGENFSKTNNLLLNTKIISGTIAGFSTSLDSDLLIRKWRSDLSTGLNPFQLGFSADFLLSDTAHQFGWNNYFTGWYESTAMAIDFSEAGLLERTTVFSISPSLDFSPVGISTELTLGSDIDAESVTSSTIEMNLKLPLKFGNSLNSVNASLGYHRSGSFTYNSSAEDFGSDVSEMLTTVAARQYLYSSAPFYELFDESLAESVFSDCSAADIDESTLENTFSASISRNYSSRLTDLLLPYSVELSLNRAITKDFNDIEEELNLDFIWRSAALNLFGTAGAYPLFNFYFSDELNWSLETAISNPFSAEAEQQYFIKSGCSFFGHNDDILSFDNSVYIPINVEDEETTVNTEIMYVWNQYPDSPIDLPIFTQKDEKLMLLTHEEKLSLNFKKVIGSEFRHTTSLILPQRFTLSVFGLAGFEIDNVSNEKTTLFGLSFGISGSIIY